MEKYAAYLPLEDIKDDSLRFKEKAQDIANEINRISSRFPYAISINGKWGSGKSTMLNFVEVYLDRDACEVIRFNPWMVNNSAELIKSLFEEIYAVLNNRFEKITGKFLEYADKIITPSTYIASSLLGAQYGIDSSISQVVGNTAGGLFSSLLKKEGDKPLSQVKKELEEVLIKNVVLKGKKIVVFIDELDRLFPFEIITVFQLLKANLSLPGIVFVVAMDKNVILSSLKELKIENPDLYLQKIFQKSFYILNTYQIRSLATNYTYRDINEIEEDRVKENIRYLIDTFLFLKRENYIKPNIKQSVNGMDPKKQEEDFYRKYSILYGSIREEYENPRSFVDFSKQLVSSLEDNIIYFQNDIPSLEKHKIQILFLLTLCNIKYHDVIEYNEFIYSNVLKDKNIPNLIRISIEIISTIKKDGPSEIEDFLKKAFIKLKPLPDYLLSKEMLDNG